MNGTCPSGCAPGWTGTICDKSKIIIQREREQEEREREKERIENI